MAPENAAVKTIKKCGLILFVFHEYFQAIKFKFKTTKPHVNKDLNY
jgi:hypothetical protein